MKSVIPAQAGIQPVLKKQQRLSSLILDSRLRGNDTSIDGYPILGS